MMTHCVLFLLVFSLSLSVSVSLQTTTFAPQSSYYTSSISSDYSEECSSNFVNVLIESPLFLQGIILSSRVNFEPYYYKYRIDHVSIYIFPSTYNPCNISSIPNIYSLSLMINNKIVLIYYLNSCNPQQCTYNMQKLGAMAVLIVNSNHLNNVYILSGQQSFNENITIPTRMISQKDGLVIMNEVNKVNSSNIEISINCDTSNKYPEIICITDKSENGDYYEYDGEYQKQERRLRINEHPIWTKQGYTNVIDEYHIYLYIDNVNGWHWIISSSYIQSNNTVFAYCNETVNDPSLCNTWYLFVESSKSFVFSSYFDSRNSFCRLSDKYLCITSSNNFMSKYIGTYHQIHDGVALWKREINNIDDREAIININVLRLVKGTYIVQSIIDVNNSILIAFCSIYQYNSSFPENSSLIFEPWSCPDVWYIFDSNKTGAISDNSFIVQYSSCSIHYTNLCINNKNNSYSPYSQYQYLYGIWKLDKTILNAHYLYINQRINIQIFWNITISLWTIIENNDDNNIHIIAICDNKYAALPLYCQCWSFINENTTICDMNITDGLINGNPVHCIENVKQSNYTPSSLCITTEDNQYIARGEYVREFNVEISDRYYWIYKSTEINQMYYIIYNDYYRFWVFNNKPISSIDSDNFNFWCLKYNELHPIHCRKWYNSKNNNYIIIDIKDCSISDEGNNNNKYGITNQELIIILILIIGLIILIIIIIIISIKCYKRMKKDKKRRKQLSAPKNLYIHRDDDFPQLPADFGDNEGRKESYISKLKISVTDQKIDDKTDDIFHHDDDDNFDDNNQFWDNFDENEIGIIHQRTIELMQPSWKQIAANSPETDISSTPNTPNSPHSTTKITKRKKKRNKLSIHHDDDDGLDL